MQCVLAVVLALVAMAAGRSPFVEWFEMKPAAKVAIKHEYVQTEFKSYAVEWESFKTTHNKQYDTDAEELTRYAVFRKNVDYIRDHNKLYKIGQKSYYLGINQFTDMPVEEFRLYNGLWRQRNLREAQCSTYLTSINLKAPDTVDWRTKGIVTPVKNQGQCGSCWSFSTTGSMEGQNARKTGNLVSFSEQQLVDCSGKYGNEGCNGGLMDQAFEYIMKYGLETESEYPYDAKQERCHYQKSETKGNCTGCVDVESGSEDDLKTAVADVGPVSIAIDASHQSFQMYRGGVYDEPDCSSTELDHGVLVVGYGTDDEKDYWLVKNSWGETWGLEGYVKMSRNNDNQCGVATQASYPLV